ncbi:MAG: C39 family peptidase [Planctomycetota bacterium]|nr:C39 family peptidase [Planctomycetota bacterium]
MHRSILLLLLALTMLPSCSSGAAPAAVGPLGEALPPRVRLAVDGRAQRRSLSCESRSAVDLLGYYDIAVTEAAFLASLPRSDNPHEGFVGDVDGPGEQLPPAGYGVYAEPVAERLRGFGLPVEVVTEMGLPALRAKLAAGHPVIVWATGALDARPAVTLTDARGRTYQAVRGEHTFIAVGYGPGTIELLDPATGKRKRVNAARFDASWAILGRMAVVATSSLG